MSKLYDAGTFQLDNGNWAFRYTFMENGKRRSRQCSKDEFGALLKTKTAAVRARNKAIEQQRLSPLPKAKPKKTINEVYSEYCEKGRFGKAYTTLLKQESLWKNHIKDRFGTRLISDLSVAEINDYLAELYYTRDYSYQYVESFLKMFYLIFGQAYSRDYIDIALYNKLCQSKDTKIHMPKIKSSEETDIAVFSPQQIKQLDQYFDGTNAETAYLLGKYCGLRINEAFGLKWNHVDFQNATITIDRQMQYQNGLIKLVPPKTRNANRTIYLCDDLLLHLKKKWQRQQEINDKMKAIRLQRQRYIEDADGNRIPSTDLVTCLIDGTLQTVNSMKYPTREIKTTLGIPFKYHYLRHTYGTRMAEMNTPTHLLCNQMGHGNIRVTQKYYLAVSQTGIEVLQNNLNQL